MVTVPCAKYDGKVKANSNGLDTNLHRTMFGITIIHELYDEYFEEYILDTSKSQKMSRVKLQ